MTNDTEYGARAHLKEPGSRIVLILSPGLTVALARSPIRDPLLAFAKHLTLEPARVAMVGDSSHDLIAGRRAGMQTVAVLTGVASEAELAPLADVVLPNIGHLPEWLAV